MSFPAVLNICYSFTMHKDLQEIPIITLDGHQASRKTLLNNLSKKIIMVV